MHLLQKKISHSGNTANLWQHMKTHKKICATEIRLQSKKRKLSSVDKDSNKDSSNVKEAEVETKVILYQYHTKRF